MKACPKVAAALALIGTPQADGVTPHTQATAIIATGANQSSLSRAMKRKRLKEAALVNASVPA